MYCTSSKRNKKQKHKKASRSGFPDPSCQCGDIKVSSFFTFSILSVPEHYTPYQIFCQSVQKDKSKDLQKITKYLQKTNFKAKIAEPP